MRKVITDRNLVHVDKDTGEALCESQGCIVIVDSQLSDAEKTKQEYIQSHEMNFQKGKTFVKLFSDALPHLTRYTTSAEFVFLINLARFVSWEDCVLRFSTNGNNHIISMKEMATLLDMDYNVVRRLVASLKKKGIIGKHETGTILPHSDTVIKTAYTVNPHIFFRGVNINKSVLAFYEDTGWKELLDKDIESSGI